MADQTNLFKATVKTIRSRLKSQGQTVQGSSNILSQTRPKGEFAVRAKDVVGGISKLKDFLMEHRKAYLHSGSLLMSEESRMTDAERDMIDTDAQTFIRTCREAIQSLKGEAANNKIPNQVKTHRNAVFNLIEEYLKAVCKIYSEQRAVRVKRVVDRKRISRLEPEKLLPRRSLLNQEIPNQEKSKAEEPKASSSKNISPIEESMPLPEDDMLSPEEQQLFEQENQQLLEDMNCIVDEVKQIEGKVVEISRLQEIFTDKVLEQEKDVDRIADTVVGTTENIKEANEEIREAMKNNAGIRIWILFFLIVLSFTLLFLDWYNP